MTHWPSHNDAAVLVTVNLDGERAILGQHPHLAPMEKTLSTTRYGLRRGVDAILGVLTDQGVPATWFVPGEVVRSHSELVRKISTGHEIAMRGDDIAPLDDLNANQVQSSLRSAKESFDALGVNPRGFRLPTGEWPEGLAQLLREIGIDWSSSFVADDLPFDLPAAGGEAILELPFHYGAEDRQSFEWNFAPAMPAGHARIASYDETLTNWKWEFDGAAAENSMFVLTITPHIIGTPGRISLLRELLAHMRSRPNTWFATGSELADHWRAVPANARGDRHPARVFLEESAWTSF